jgi:hypothetical protein
VKDVARDEHEVRLQLDDFIDDTLQRASDVGFTLVDACWCLALKLAEAEVDVGEVDDPHRARIARIH